LLNKNKNQRNKRESSFFGVQSLEGVRKQVYEATWSWNSQPITYLNMRDFFYYFFVSFFCL
jgi:hypothetical protein